MSKKLLSALWIFTAFVTIMLIAATVNVARKARASQEAGFVGYITGVNSAVYVYERPRRTSSILTIVDLETPVLVKDSSEDGDMTWYLIRSENAEGWLPSERVSTEPPERQ